MLVMLAMLVLHKTGGCLSRSSSREVRTRVPFSCCLFPVVDLAGNSPPKKG